MILEDQIQALLAEAEPLRCLPDDEPMKARLTHIVNAINALRHVQSLEVLMDQMPAPVAAPVASVEGADPIPEPVRRGPGRPRKTVEAI